MLNDLLGDDKQRQALRREAGNWLFAGRWDFYVTLTTAYPKSVRTLWSDFYRWVSCLEQRSKKNIAWFAVTEEGRYYRQHMHALIGRASDLEVTDLSGCWRSGRSEVRRYDSHFGAAFYIAKTLDRPDADWDVSKCWVHQKRTHKETTHFRGID